MDCCCQEHPNTVCLKFFNYSDVKRTAAENILNTVSMEILKVQLYNVKQTAAKNM